MRAHPFALSTALIWAGCTGGDPAASTLALDESVAVLHVDQAAGEPAAGRVAVTAAFARYRGIDASRVLSLLGVGATRASDRCSFVGESELARPAGVSLSSEAEVELLELGAIRVWVPEEGTRLQGDAGAARPGLVLVPRAFPDLGSLIAGVIYAGEADGRQVAYEPGEFAFAAPGSAELGGFETVVPAPRSLQDIRVDGDELSEVTSLSRDAGFDVQWTAQGDHDIVEVEIRAYGDVVSCAVRDDGSFRVDADSLAVLAPDHAATLLLRRVRVTPVDVPGLESGFARIALTQTSYIELR